MLAADVVYPASAESLPHLLATLKDLSARASAVFLAYVERSTAMTRILHESVGYQGCFCSRRNLGYKAWLYNVKCWEHQKVAENENDCTDV